MLRKQQAELLMQAMSTENTTVTQVTLTKQQTDKQANMNEQ